MDWPEMIARVPLLEGLPQAARSSSRVRFLPAATLLFNRTERPAQMFTVLEGEVRLVRRALNGAQIILQRARKSLLAEASLDQSAYHCDAIAVTDATVLTTPIHQFKAAFDIADFQKAWMSHLIGELRRVRSQNERLSLRTARERIVHAVETEGHDGVLILSQTKKDWASELGLTHEALYRALAQMQSGQELEVDGPILRLAIRQ